MLFAVPRAVFREKCHEQVLNFMTGDAMFQVVDLIFCLASCFSNLVVNFSKTFLQELHSSLSNSVAGNLPLQHLDTGSAGNRILGKNEPCL